MIDKNFIPKLPFDDFKWKWASVAPTEGINDPVVLLGVLSRIAKLSGTGLKYSSEEFQKELIDLAEDLQGTGVNVDLAGRGGDRNIMRNSGQYWKALNLIPNERGGKIQVTPFGRKVAENEISQSEFSATVLMTYTLPNPNIQTEEECQKWKRAGIKLQPLKLLLEITRGLSNRFQNNNQGYLTKEELVRIVIPLSAYLKKIDDYVDYICLYREGNLNISSWPNVCPMSNDKRMAREFMLFLSNYGYFHVEKREGVEFFYYNYDIDEEIQEILSKDIYSDEQCLEFLRSSGVTLETERKLITGNINKNARGALQTKFRKDLLDVYPKCILSEINMHEVLVAAHIKPVEYNGGYDVSNGFLMRTDLHLLFDANHLRIKPSSENLAEVEVDEMTRLSYGHTIPSRIILPNYVSIDNLRWRYDNYKGIKMSNFSIAS